MKASSIFLILVMVLSLFLVAGCAGPKVYRQFYGEAIHTYTAPSTPKLEDVPKQFLRDDDTNYVLYLEDAIVAPNTYDLSGLNTFFKTKMCSIVTGAGYQCRDMNNNPITGSLFKGITGASISDVTGRLVTNVATNTLFQCRRNSHGMDDYYVNIGYPCPVDSTLSILGRTLVNPPAEYPASAGILKYCYWDDKDEHLIALNNCDSGTDWRADLGYVYTTPVSGTIKLSRCRYNANEEHTQVIGDCEAGMAWEGSWYILPFCEDSDGGNNLNVKGTVTTATSDPNMPLTDSCDGTAAVTEYYCNPNLVPVGQGHESIACPSGQACVEGACVASPAAYRFNLHKEGHFSDTDRKISYYIEVRNEGPATPNEEDVVVVTDLLPAGVAVESVTPAPSIQSGRTLKWVFEAFDNDQMYALDSKFDDQRGYTVYRSRGRFPAWINVSVDAGTTGTLMNEANVTMMGMLKASRTEDVVVSAGAGPAPSATPNMVIVGTDTNIAGHGGDVNFVETPYCPRGTKKFGEIFEFHQYNNEYGQRWAFCSVPGVYGQINTCSIEDTSDVNPWTSACEPALCPDGMAAFGGLIKHGYYVRPGLNTYRYINMYSRICLSTDALNAGTVKTCGNQQTTSETDECDTTPWKDDSDGLVCPAGQTQVQNGLVTDPVTSAHDISGGSGAPIWEFRYNNVCADFKAISASANPPWENGFACAANSDCNSGYCNGATKVCEVAPVAPAQNMVIVSTDTYVPGHGGDLNYFPDPVCPYGTSSIGQIYEFHGYNNEVGRKFAFCTKPGITGSILTCDTEDSSSVNPWTSKCDPGACPAGTTALTGLIKHGQYLRPGLHTFVYFNQYSRVCLSNNAIYGGHVQSCGNQDAFKGETGECDSRGYEATAGGLACAAGEEPVSVLIGDPVVSAHDLVGNKFRYWEYRYNRLCIDFKENIPYCGDGIRQLNEQCEFDWHCPANQTCRNCMCVQNISRPWPNSYPCASHSDCVSGYCNPATNTCTAAPGAPTSYRILIPGSTLPTLFTTSNFNTWKSVLVGTCTDNGHVATALGTAECTALTPGKALLLLTHNPYRLVIAAGDTAGVGIAINVLRNGANYNVHGPRVDITYSGTAITRVSFPHCSDGTRNFDETGTDCGGSCPACAGAAPTCSDHTQNQGETGVDCGGPCAACSYPPATSGGTPSGSSGGGGRRNVPATTTPSQAGSAECYDDWICTAWTLCSESGLQTRACSFNDYPACTLIIQKPSEQQSCRPSVVAHPPVVAVENCFDGMQNQNEEGIDCGGICAPCPGRASWLIPLIIVLVVIAIVLGFFIYYNKFLKKPDVLSPLRKYVKDARSKSIPDSRIRQILVNQGWSQSDIGKVMGK